MDVEFLRHTFEDRQDGVVVKHRFRLGVRHIQATYMAACAVTLGALRGSTGIAVMALSDSNRRNDTYIQIQNWDGKVQGAILSSFLFGYALSVLPAELLLRRVKTGGKHILTAVLVLAGGLAAAMPTIVHRGGWVAVCNAQLWMGVGQGFLTPANQALLVRFLLPSERNFIGYIVHGGTVIGVVMGLPIAGKFSEADLGWELVFYGQAILALSVACMWGLLTASTPEGHEAMGDTEKEVIKEALSSYRKKVILVPWKRILFSRQFWAVAAAHAASNAVFVFYLFHVPALLISFGLSLRTSSWQAALPFLSFILIRLTTAPTIDWFLRSLKLSFQVNLTYLRKLINSVGVWGVVAGLIVLPNLMESWHVAAVALLVGIAAMIGFQLCGFLENVKDMSENYHGSVFVLSRSVAGCCGAFVPVLVGHAQGDHFSDVSQWRPVLLSLAGVYAACNTLYTVAGSSERQPWDGGLMVKDKTGYFNAMMDGNQLELEELSHKRKQTSLNLDIDTGNTDV